MYALFAAAGGDAAPAPPSPAPAPSSPAPAPASPDLFIAAAGVFQRFLAAGGAADAADDVFC